MPNTGDTTGLITQVQQWTQWPIYGSSGDTIPSGSMPGVNYAVWEGGTVGNGSAFIRTRRVSGLYAFSLYLVWGTTTTITGASAGNFLYLPPGIFEPSTSVATSCLVGPVINALAQHDNGLTVYRGTGIINPTGSVGLDVWFGDGTFSGQTYGITATVPFTWTAGDTLVLTGAVEADGA